MTVIIQKWGNARAVPIPKSLAVKLGFEIGREVELTENHGHLIIRPARKRSRYRLAELLVQCSAKNHPEMISNRSGKELH